MTGPAREIEGALLADLYELTMAQSYLDEGVDGRPATFSVFVRHLPAGWGYLVAAGLDDVLRALESFAFAGDDLDYLSATGLFTDRFLGHLAGLRFEGEVRAMPEGTAFFPDEPLLELRAPLLQAQLLETVVVNELHFQSLVASKAARFVDAAEGRSLIDVGLRRAQGGAAGLRSARSSFLAGFDATSSVAAGGRYGMEVAGTMAHSYVQAFADELESFRAYARAYPNRSILLVDTYDAIQGARLAAVVGRELAQQGHRLAGIRLDSGDLATLAREVRSILDDAGLGESVVYASGGLDERDVAELVAAGAPVGGFGIGSQLASPADAPCLDMAYKLVEVGGRPTVELSPGKATLPGAKQVWRVSLGGRFAYDVVAPASAAGPPGGEPQLELVMAGGRRIVRSSLEDGRERCRQQRARLPDEHRRVDAECYEVRISDSLIDVRDRVIAELREREALGGD